MYGSEALYSTLLPKLSDNSCKKNYAPNTPFGYKLPRTGNNFVFSNSIGNYELTQPLIKNKLYVFECYLSTPTSFKTIRPFSINHFRDTSQGIFRLHFLKNVKDSVDYNKTFNSLFIKNIKTIDTLGWTKISTCFTVQDTARAFGFLFNIGAFIDDIAIYPAASLNSNIIQLPCKSTLTFSVSNTNSNFSYYYVFGNGQTFTTKLNSYAYDYEKSGTYPFVIILKDTINNEYACQTDTVNIVSVKASFDLPEKMLTDAYYNAVNKSSDMTTSKWILNNQDLDGNKFSSPIFENELCLIVSNAKNACMDTLCQSFTLKKCGVITSSNTFSPNFDKINDVFYFFETEPCDTTNLKICVYDRWGKEFYHYPNPNFYTINPTQISESFMKYSYKFWNGYSNNLGPKFADSGVYFFIVENGEKRKTGTIQVFRD